MRAKNTTWCAKILIWDMKKKRWRQWRVKIIFQAQTLRCWMKREANGEWQWKTVWCHYNLQLWHQHFLMHLLLCSLIITNNSLLSLCRWVTVEINQPKAYYSIVRDCSQGRFVAVKADYNILFLSGHKFTSSGCNRSASFKMFFTSHFKFK